MQDSAEIQARQVLQRLYIFQPGQQPLIQLRQQRGVRQVRPGIVRAALGRVFPRQQDPRPPLLQGFAPGQDLKAARTQHVCDRAGAHRRFDFLQGLLPQLQAPYLCHPAGNKSTLAIIPAHVFALAHQA